jgi:hypothetical protein
MNAPRNTEGKRRFVTKELSKECERRVATRGRGEDKGSETKGSGFHEDLSPVDFAS